MTKRKHLDLKDFQILLVEDEYILARDLSTTLHELGATIIGPAPSAEHALSLIDSTTIQFGVLDINLRGATVFPVADLLARKKVPFVFLSGYDDFPRPSRHMDRPMCEKPVELPMLLRCIRNAILP